MYIGCSWLLSPNRFRAVRDHCIFSGGGSVVRAVAHYYLIQRHGSGDPTLCGGYPGPDCSSHGVIFSVCLSWPIPVMMDA